MVDPVKFKKFLKTAKSADFSIYNLDFENGDIRYVVLFLGTLDVAWFIRKSDAESFIQTFVPKVSQ